MLKKLYIIICMCCVAGIAIAQDIHFSDFMNTPLNLNPALAGDFDGNYRVNAVYRWQYGTVTVPYSTISLGTDFKHNANRKKKKPFGYGFIINYDKTGDSRYTTLQMGIPVAYHYLLSSKKAMVSFGINPQFCYNSINYSSLNFPDQFIDDKYYWAAKSLEPFTNQSISYFNLTAGVHIKFLASQKSVFETGFAINNISTPKLSFFSDNTSVLLRRYSLDANYKVRVSKRIDIEPSGKFQFQGSQKEYQYGGTLFRYFDNLMVSTVDGAIWYRSRDKDAIILHLGFDYEGYRVGLNYDINISTLDRASYGVGAFEITLIYIYSRFNQPHKFKSIKCPNALD